MRAALATLVASLLATAAHAALPASGEPLRAAGEGGWAPVARTAEIAPSPCGVVDIFCKGPCDLFISARQVYPFEGFGPDGAPRYGLPVDMAAPSTTGSIFADSGGTIRGLFWSGKTLGIRSFSTATLSFGGAISRTLSLPGNIRMAAAQVSPGGKLQVYLRSEDGVEYLPPGVPQDWPSHRPYDGAGIWRGGIPGDYLSHARFSSATMTTTESVSQPFGTEGMFLFNNGNLAVVDLGPGRERDVISTEKLGLFRYFRVADPESGVPAAPVNVRNTRATALFHPIINPRAVAMPNATTGLSDLIVGDTCRIWWYRFPGEFALDGAPIYDDALPVLRRDGTIPFGALAVIAAGDVDGDGLVDIVAGNDGGQLLFIRNVGSPTSPDFALPEHLPVDGGPVRIRAGYAGSLQGPGEAAWGYSCPTLADWNGDGRLDVVMSSILADYVVLLQKDSPSLAFEAPHPIYCEGLGLHLTWRQQPAVTDWGLPGRLDIVTLNEQDRLATFTRLDDHNVERGPLLLLESGDPITANYRSAGQTGRTKLDAVDWDGDGDIDLLVGARRAHSLPRPEGGLPWSLPGDDMQATVLLLRNKGPNAAPALAEPELVRFRGDMIRLGVHSCSPAAVDLGRGVLDLLVAEENGSVIFFAQEDLTP